MKKNDTEFARFKREMARMEAQKRKDELALKSFKGIGKSKKEEDKQ